MADDTPSWLIEDSPDEAAPPPSAALQAASTPKSELINEDGDIIDDADGGTASMIPNSSAGATPAEEEKDLPRIVLFMRLANLAAAGALIAVSIVMMVGMPRFTVWVLSVYATCGGILICCLETQLKFLRVAIAMNFGFLFSAPLRFLFYILLAAICWTYGRIFGPAVAIGMVVVAVFNSYILCRYPTYRRVREKIAEEEDKRIEAKISGEVKKQAFRSLTG